MKHIQRQQFSFTKKSIKASLKILSLQALSPSLCLSRLPVVCFFQRSCWNCRPCRLQTADYADRVDCADWGGFYLYLNFLVKFLPWFPASSHYVHCASPSYLHWCVYLQGSWVGNEKITGSCLPADVKAVSRAFSCAAFTQERARWRKVSCFFL